MGLFGVSETLSFEVPQFVRTLRVVGSLEDSSGRVPTGLPGAPQEFGNVGT